MKRENLYKKIVFALFALLLVAACDKEEWGDTPADAEPQQIRFDIAVATATPSDPSTRVGFFGTDGITSTFTAGDKVGLYIVKGDGELKSSDNWVDNALMTCDGASWSCDLPADKRYYPTDGNKLSFYAYYPYKEGVTNPLEMSFSVQEDQSAGLSPSYLMTASRKGVSKSRTPVQLTFAHKLALVKVNLIDGNEAKDKAPRPADVVTLKGRQLTTSLNLATGNANTSGDAADVKMHYNTTDSCWYALVPRQGVDKGSELLTFEWAHILTLKHKPERDLILPVGEVKPLEISIDAKIDPNHVYAVGDAYPYAGFEKKGVVFEVSNGGKSGKIISPKREYGLYWSTDTATVTNANSKLNGRVNMVILRTSIHPEYPQLFEKYQAFNVGAHCLNPENTTYAADSKGLWYLPADEELKSMYAADNKEKVSRRLKALGLEDPFPENNTYIWSSTEDDLSNPQRKAHAIRLSDGTIFTFDKNEGSLYTWPIMAF